VDEESIFLAAIENMLNALGFMTEGKSCNSIRCLDLESHRGGMSVSNCRADSRLPLCPLPVIFIIGVDDQAVREQALKGRSRLIMPFLPRLLIDAIDTGGMSPRTSC